MKNPLILTLASTSTAFFAPARRHLPAGGGRGHHHHHHRGYDVPCRPGGGAQASTSTTSTSTITSTSASSATTTTRLHFFERLDRAFEDDGPLGRGITVGKVQVALNVDGIGRASGGGIPSSPSSKSTDATTTTVTTTTRRTRGAIPSCRKCATRCAWRSCAGATIGYRRAPIGGGTGSRT